VADSHTEATTSGHTHSHADAGYARRNSDTYCNTDRDTVKYGFSYADRDAYTYVDTDTDRNLDADEYTHTNSNLHAKRNVDQHTHRHEYRDADCDADEHTNADDHAAALSRQYTARRTEHRPAKWNGGTDCLRRLPRRRSG
jgi:hypothetical protein